MRDKNRIKEICNEIAEIWEKVPDWRFMQVINNFQRYIKYNYGDGFYLEDNKFIDILDEYISMVIDEECI